MGLTIQFSVQYPYVPPKFAIVSNSLTSVGVNHHQQLKTLLETAAKLFVGQQMVFSFVNIVEKWLELTSFHNNNENQNLGFAYQDSLRLILSTKQYECLTPAKILELHRQQIKFIKEKLEISSSLSRALLSSFKWNNEKLLEVYKVASSSKESLDEFFSKYGFVHMKPLNTEEIFEKKIECPSCLDEFGVENMTAVTCGHFYCNSCYTNYITVQIAEGSYYFFFSLKVINYSKSISKKLEQPLFTALLLNVNTLLMKLHSLHSLTLNWFINTIGTV